MSFSSYLAPSRNGYGWGVFASKAFHKGDIVELAPMFLRVDLEENRSKVLKETVLNNYHYEYWGWDGIRGKECQYSMISFGMTLYYNHQSPSQTTDLKVRLLDTPMDRKLGPNIEQRKVGTEPDVDVPDRAVAIIYFALRDIIPGEELLVDYGGSDWFQERGVHEIVTRLEDSQDSQDITPHEDRMNALMKQLSGKLSAGYHQQAFARVVGSIDQTLLEDPQPYRLETALDLLPTVKVCFGNVVARERVLEGETIEFVPALLLRKDLVQCTLLEPLALVWDDFDKASPSFANGRPEHVQVQYQPDIDEIVASISLKVKREETVLFALAGHISLMAKVDMQNGTHNAVLQIEDDPCNEGGYCVRVLACQSVTIGERIIVGVSRWDPASVQAIVEELSLTGQQFDAELSFNA